MEKEIKHCQCCKKDFVLNESDVAFYSKLNVPHPTWCPECRMCRRLAFRNERGLYKRSCDLCHKKVIGMHREGTAFPVYCRECWYSDSWDPMIYGKSYDFNKNFFVQLQELLKSVPRIALQVDQSVSCEYANQIARCKNCYLISSGSDNEDCYYSQRILNSKNVFDALLVNHLEYSFEAIECMDSSNLIYCREISDSYNLAFCYDCRGVENGFMSANQRRSRFVFRNKQMTKDEYEKERSEIDTGSYVTWSRLKEEYARLTESCIHRYAGVKNGINVSGHAIVNSKDCRTCFGVGECENCSYCMFVNNAKDICDVNNGCCVMERVYEACTAGVNASDIRFCIDAWPEIQRAEYCDSCRNGSADLFGCVALRKKQFCILNKQYERDEYEKSVQRIKQHMNDVPYTDRIGRVYFYGEFFPPELSPYPYNDSVAHAYYQKTKEEAQMEGWNWTLKEKLVYKITKASATLPDHIKDVDDSILSDIIECEHKGECEDQCSSAFRILREELEMYRKFNLPLPRMCPNCRHYARLKTRNPLKLWNRRCNCSLTSHEHGGVCVNKFETTYAPERKEIIYCESCYQTEVQ